MSPVRIRSPAPNPSNTSRGFASLLSTFQVHFRSKASYRSKPLRGSHGRHGSHFFEDLVRSQRRSFFLSIYRKWPPWLPRRQQGRRSTNRCPGSTPGVDSFKVSTRSESPGDPMIGRTILHCEVLGGLSHDDLLPMPIPPHAPARSIPLRPTSPTAPRQHRKRALLSPGSHSRFSSTYYNCELTPPSGTSFPP